MQEKNTWQKVYTEIGISQGHVMSFWLFNTFMDVCLKNACNDIKDMLVESMNMHALFYIDNIMLLAENMNVK